MHQRGQSCNVVDARPQTVQFRGLIVIKQRRDTIAQDDNKIEYKFKPRYR